MRSGVMLVSLVKLLSLAAAMMLMMSPAEAQWAMSISGGASDQRCVKVFGVSCTNVSRQARVELGYEFANWQGTSFVIVAGQTAGAKQEMRQAASPFSSVPAWISVVESRKERVADLSILMERHLSEDWTVQARLGWQSTTQEQRIAYANWQGEEHAGWERAESTAGALRGVGLGYRLSHGLVGFVQVQQYNVSKTRLFGPAETAWRTSALAGLRVSF